MTRPADIRSPQPAPTGGDMQPTEIQQLVGPRHQVLQVVGAGASSVVCKVADHTVDGEIKAAKIADLTPREGHADPLRELCAEFELGSHFHHPNLVTHFGLDILPQPGPAVTTMEFVDGAPFGVGAAHWGVNPVAELMAQLLRGLQFLHDADLVHGDVKPANALCSVVRAGSQLKLLDYHLTFRAALQMDATTRGTLRYMAPEVIAGEQPDARSDLYSAGVLFFEALTGRTLFAGGPGDVVTQHLTAPLEQMQGRASALGPVLARLLAKSPSARYASAADAISAIGEALGRDYAPETRGTLLGRARSAPMLGRDDALTEFEQSLSLDDEAAAGPGIFLVGGASGAGRTRYLRECELRAQMRGLATLHCGSAEEGLEPILGRAEKWLAIGGPGHEGAAAGLEMPPSVGAATVAMPDPLPAPMIRRLNAISEGLLAAAAMRPMVLLIDDVDELGAAGLAALSFLVRATAHTRVRSCFSLRSGTGRTALVADFIDKWQECSSVHEVQLSELAPQARRQLVASMLPAATAPALIDSLVATCGGSPQVITATIEHLASNGHLALDARGRVTGEDRIAAAAPANIRALAGTLLTGAEATVQEAFGLLAVADEEVELQLLADAAGAPVDVLEDCIRSTAASSAVSFRATTRGRLCKFQHRFLADSILELLPAERVQFLHDRLADALQRTMPTPSTDTSIRIARHRLLGTDPQTGVKSALEVLRQQDAHAGREDILGLATLSRRHVTDPDKTELLELSGDVNCSRGSYAAATELFRAALDPTLSEQATRLRLTRKLAAAHANLGDYGQAGHLLEDALGRNFGSDRASLAEAAHAKLALARVHTHRSAFAEAKTNCEQAATIAKELGDGRLIGVALQYLGLNHLRTGAMEEGAKQLLEALSHLRHTDSQVETGEVLASLGTIAIKRQKWQCARGLLERSLRVVRNCDVPAQTARVLSNLGAIHCKLCDWPEAENCYSRALTLYRSLAYARGTCALLLNLSQVSAAQGKLEDALDRAQQALETGPAEPSLRCQARLRIAGVRYALGDLATARETATSALEEAAAASLSPVLESANRILGEIALVQDDLGTARDRLSMALRLARKNGSREREAVCLARLAEVAIAEGNPQNAYALVDEALAKARLGVPDSVKALCQTVRGKANLASGDIRGAMDDLLAAEEIVAKTHVCEELMDVALHLGRAYELAGQRRFAAFHFRSALNTVEEMAQQIRSPQLRKVYLSDPRRGSLFAALRALRATVDGSQTVSHERGACDGD